MIPSVGRELTLGPGQGREASIPEDYEFVEGATSDLSFVARGPTLEALFGAASRALLAASVEEPERVREVERRPVRLEEPDLELLLLRFLNELVYLRDAEGLLLRAATLRVVSEAGGARLEGELAGERLSLEKHRPLAEVKAVTAHGLEVARTQQGWRASITLDV
jgi:SHS2 domain-containing protein